MEIYIYSVYNNQDILANEIGKTGYVVFDRKLRYMGCSEYATVLFPELKQWELEKRIPGNGGRFNTFLRQPLNSYTEKDDAEEDVNGNYEYKGEIYRYEMRHLKMTGNRDMGYIIRISNVTDVLDDGTGSGSERTEATAQPIR